jgi:hypothetical protein
VIRAASGSSSGSGAAPRVRVRVRVCVIPRIRVRLRLRDRCWGRVRVSVRIGSEAVPHVAAAVDVKALAQMGETVSEPQLRPRFVGALLRHLMLTHCPQAHLLLHPPVLKAFLDGALQRVKGGELEGAPPCRKPPAEWHGQSLHNFLLGHLGWHMRLELWH